MTTTTEQQIENAIAESGGSIHDALNVALAQRDLATAKLRAEQERSAVLSVALEAIDDILSIGLSRETTMRAIKKIARHGKED